jgi:transposase
MYVSEFCQLLLNTDQFEIDSLVVEENEIKVGVESTAHSARCPKCQQESSALHSHYVRYPRDLAWAEQPVVVELQVKRFFCHNPSCSKRTFAERFPDFVGWYARKTERVLRKQRRVGANVCAKIAEPLLVQDQIGVSDTTINRIVRQLPDPPQEPVRVLGVDDWAKRKRQHYGTILVDLERGRVVDLLADRTAECLVPWLVEHPEVEIVSRDRSPVYADAIRQGAAQAIQVADRWHLLHNASEALLSILQQENPLIQKYLNPIAEPAHRSEIPAPPVRAASELTASEERRKQRMETAQELHRRGHTQKAIARQLHVHTKTVRRYLHRSSPKVPRYRRHRLLDPFHPYLLQRWNEGCYNAKQLYREIRAQGYTGSATMVRTALQPFRTDPAQPRQAALPGKAGSSTPRTLRMLDFWILQRPEDRQPEHELLLEQICVELPRLKQVILQARQFAAMLREHTAEELTPWMEQAEASGYRVWKNFAAGIRQDRDAVEAALTHNWSNGPTEGHVNRLKCLKRQMYGRAKDDLLRKRVLWQGRWGFT